MSLVPRRIVVKIHFDKERNIQPGSFVFPYDAVNMETFADVYAVTEQRCINIGPYTEGWIREIFVNAYDSSGQSVREKVEVDDQVEPIYFNSLDRFTRVSSIEIIKERSISVSAPSPSTAAILAASIRAPKANANTVMKTKPKKSTGAQKAGSKTQATASAATTPQQPVSESSSSGGAGVVSVKRAAVVRAKRYHFDEADDRRLLEGIALYGGIGMDETRQSKRLKRGNWHKVAEYVGRGITNDQCFNRWKLHLNPEVTRLKEKRAMAWSDDEINKLMDYVEENKGKGYKGSINWGGVAAFIGRDLNACSTKYYSLVNDMKDKDKGPFTKEEDDLIMAKIAELGDSKGRFELVAGLIGGRSGKTVQRRWRTLFSAQLEGGQSSGIVPGGDSGATAVGGGGRATRSSSAAASSSLSPFGL